MSENALPAHPRPLSPHLSIYRPQISSVLSILHRITGVGLYVGALLLTWWVVTLAYSSFRPMPAFWDCFTGICGQVLLIGWSFALFYHMLNGIRHLFWDVGKGFELKTMCRTGWAVILGAVVLTASAWTLVWLYYHQPDLLPWLS